MPIINLQRSVHQVGRIRLGEQTTTGNGKARPTKLSTFRLTSPQRQPIDAAARLYGGQVQPFDNDRSDDRWQVTTDTDAIPVVIPPTHHLDQWLEAWTNGGCDRRCDGQTMTVHKGQAVDQACMCDPDNRVCKITTRLWVVLPELEALGVWRLESHGYYAAAELAGAADLCAAVTAQGRAIPARLHLEQRTRRNAGQTYRFAVPVLSVDVSLPQAKAILGQADVATGEITTPTTRQLEQPTPRAIEPPAEPAPRVELPPPPPADIPTPRTHDQFEADQGAEIVTPQQAAAVVDVLNSIDDNEARASAKREFVARYGRPDQLTADNYDVALIYAQGLAIPAPTPEPEQPKLVDTLPAPDATPITSKGDGRFTPKQQREFFALWGELAPKHGWAEDDRHARIKAATGGRTDSWAEVTQLEADQLLGDLRALKKGAA